MFLQVMGPTPDSIQTTKELVNNIVMSASLSDFISTVEKLDMSGLNWVIFQSRFMIAISQKDMEDHFDGSSPKMVLSYNMTDEAKEEFAKASKTWKKKEALALYLLMQKLPESTFPKYMCKTSVAQVWSGLCPGGRVFKEINFDESKSTRGIHGYAIQKGSRLMNQIQ